MMLLRKILFPFAIIYELITTLRNWLYDASIFKSHQFDFPIISVGNLNVGGTGKTPMIEYLIRLLGDKKIAVLSRGYKRKSKGFVLLDNTIDATIVGDEPFQFYSKFPNIKVAVCENRVDGVQKLTSLFDFDVILLDDAFQHRKIKPSFSILLTAFDDLFIDDLILPSGNLRENKRGVKRADVIVVTKCKNDLNQTEIERVKQRFKKFNKSVFFTTINYANILIGDRILNLKDLIKYQVLLLTGIANPKPLLKFLTSNQINFEHLSFADHHDFTDKDISFINSKFNSLKTSNKIIVTTEKDFMRLKNKIDGLFYIQITTTFLLQEDEEKFNRLIKKQLIN